MENSKNASFLEECEILEGRLDEFSLETLRMCFPQALALPAMDRKCILRLTLRRGCRVHDYFEIVRTRNGYVWAMKPAYATYRDLVRVPGDTFSTDGWDYIGGEEYSPRL